MLRNIKVNYKKMIIVTSVLFLALLSFFFIGQKSITLYQHLKTDLNDPNNDEDPGTDNWEISTVIYDSAVNDGNTPLTEINWDASDGGYNNGETRTFKIQINYKNTNVIKDYNKNEVLIRIPGLLTNNLESSMFISTIVIGANDSSHTNYDWNFQGLRSDDNTYSNVSSYLYQYYYFFNDKIINKNTNIEGSIQIIITLQPKYITPVQYDDTTTISINRDLMAELFALDKENEKVIAQRLSQSYDNALTYSNGKYTYESNYGNTATVHFDSISSPSYNVNMMFNDANGETFYTLKDIRHFVGNYYPLDHKPDNITMTNTYNKLLLHIIPTTKYQGNHLQFNYTRVYNHPWIRKEYQDQKQLYSLSNIDNLPTNYNDYYWVKYIHNTGLSISNFNPYPKIYVMNQDAYITDSMPEGVLVYDKNMYEIDAFENNIYKYTTLNDPSTYTDETHTYGSSTNGKILFLAFPKSIYNEENDNLTVTIPSAFYGKYLDRDSYELLDSENVTINLLDYSITIPEESYKINKTSISNSLYAQDIRNNTDNEIVWGSNISANYFGEPYTIKIGDDILYTVDDDGTINRLLDDEYYFSSIYINQLPKRDYGTYLDFTGKYDCELWVRYRNENNYTQ